MLVFKIQFELVVAVLFFSVQYHHERYPLSVPAKENDALVAKLWQISAVVLIERRDDKHSLCEHLLQGLQVFEQLGRLLASVQ